MTAQLEDAAARRRVCIARSAVNRDPQALILVEIDRRYGSPVEIPRFIVPLQILRHFDFDRLI